MNAERLEVNDYGKIVEWEIMNEHETKGVIFLTCKVTDSNIERNEDNYYVKRRAP
jgi:hypothetical protein